ncbi:MAG: threonine/serine dehydratase [Gemmatimonadaceae bacterium]|nr:threonine/serine dehydratase [Gemmatimonadaceae bacterium]
MLPPAAAVLAAGHRLRGVVERTPLVPSPALSLRANTDVHLKCECRQRTGSFKIRGAYNVLATMSIDEKARGVVASSAGNHGLGLAWAARHLGIRATIFVPATAPSVKREGIVALGAVIDASQPDYDAAHRVAEEFARAHEMVFVNPCAGDLLLAGQGTVALEILEELPSVETIVVPVGGGGLIGGVASLVRVVAPHVRLIGVQSVKTNAMAASLAAGQRVDVPVPPTLADGLAGQIDDEGFAIGRASLDEIVTVTEHEIAEAIAWLSHEHDMRVEGSGAVGVAALLHQRAPSLVSPVAVVVSGGNIDDARWRAIVDGPGAID